jgi:hypothetical protein
MKKARSYIKDKPLQGLRVSPSWACGGTGGARDGAEPQMVQITNLLEKGSIKKILGSGPLFRKPVLKHFLSEERTYAKETKKEKALYMHTRNKITLIYHLRWER